MALLRKGTVSMRRKLSKKQIGAMGMAVLMSAQGAAMAAETSTEAVTKEIQTEQQEEPASEITEVELASAQDEENELPENTTQVEQEKLQEAESQTEIESEMQISSDTEIESEMQTQMKTENESQTQSELESEVTEELEPSTSLMDEAALQIERPEEIAELCDVFYIGGTKVGALCGEAVVFPHHNTPKHFVTQIKQRGALLAKGRLLGIQFDTLFTDNLYFEISKHAIEMAEKLKEVFHKKGYTFFLESPTNQQFIILENEKMKELSENVEFGFWEKYDDNHTVVRFATSWSTDENSIDQLEEYL